MLDFSHHSPESRILHPTSKPRHSSNNENLNLAVYVSGNCALVRFFIFAHFLNSQTFLFCFIFLFFLFIGEELYAQTKNKPGFGNAIVKAKGVIVTDGVLDEEDWKTASVATNFFLNYPVDSLPPAFQTEVRLTYDEDFFYLSFVC